MPLEIESLTFTPWPPAPTKGMLTGTMPRGVLVTHLPTGMNASCVRFRHQHLNRDGALERLNERMSCSELAQSEAYQIVVDAVRCDVVQGTAIHPLKDADSPCNTLKSYLRFFADESLHDAVLCELIADFPELA